MPDLNLSQPSSAYSDIYVNTTENLTSNLTCENMVIGNNVTLYANGYNIICFGNFTNYGTIITGLANNSGDGYHNAISYPHSIGGSGGGDSFPGVVSFSSLTEAGSTLAYAGLDLSNAHGGNVTTPSTPNNITNSVLTNWYVNSMSQYLTGGGGAGGIGEYGGNDQGADGANGIYIQAESIFSPGNIIDDAQNTSEPPI